MYHLNVQDSNDDV